MHDQFANGFYGSTEWQKCRAAYRKAKNGLCERCLARGLIVPGTEVHHKVRITPKNMKNPAITLNWNNLELLCAACHEEEHKRTVVMRTDLYGHVDI